MTVYLNLSPIAECGGCFHRKLSFKIQKPGPYFTCENTQIQAKVGFLEITRKACSGSRSKVFQSVNRNLYAQVRFFLFQSNKRVANSVVSWGRLIFVCCCCCRSFWSCLFGVCVNILYYLYYPPTSEKQHDFYSAIRQPLPDTSG